MPTRHTFTQQIFSDALTLPPVERATLANNLMRSLTPASQVKIDKLWAKEAEDRIDAFERGEIKSSPIADVFARINNKK